MSAPIIAGAVVCCLVTIALVTVLSVRLSVASQENCTGEMFDDIASSNFTLREQFFTVRSEMKISDQNGQEIGRIAMQPSLTKTLISFHDMQGQVVAQAVKSAFAWSWRIGRCEKGVPGPAYLLERIFFTLGVVEFNLYKNGVLIGNPAKKTWFTCKPDVIIESPNGTLIATASRSCLGSLFLDDWRIINYDHGNLENYVVALIGYITTQQENMSSSSSSSKKKKN